MASIYVDRAILRSPLGIFTLRDGDIKNVSLNINADTNPVQGNTLDNSTSGYVIGNRVPTLTFTVMLRRKAALVDYLKTVDSSIDFNIDLLTATSGSGTQVGMTTKITLIRCVVGNANYGFPAIGQAATQDFTFMAEDYSATQVDNG